MTWRLKLVLGAGVIYLAYVMIKFLKNNAKRSKGKDKPGSSKKFAKESYSEADSSESFDSNKRKLEEEIKIMKIFKQKPNFFLGIKIYDTEIHQNVKKIQEKIVEKNKALHAALVNIATLHITLAVTHLPDEPGIKLLKAKLNEWAEKNKKTFFNKPIVLNFNGIKTFNDVVAYVAIEEDEGYEKLSLLSQYMNDILLSAGFSTDQKSFTPHLTILKLSKDFKLIRSKKKFKNDFEFLKEIKDHFGQQQITQIQLLSMNEPKDEFGYYKCFHQINISELPSKADHSECCSPIPKPSKMSQSKS